MTEYRKVYKKLCSINNIRKRKGEKTENLYDYIVNNKIEVYHEEQLTKHVILKRLRVHNANYKRNTTLDEYIKTMGHNPLYVPTHEYCLDNSREVEDVHEMLCRSFTELYGPDHILSGNRQLIVKGKNEL